ncbi:MAG: hypothetical protein KDK66_03620 [Deltaproteobacteria bacterium]|nr:hypothetical protein [Deltaproteobacteria bacterium]
MFIFQGACSFALVEDLDFDSDPDIVLSQSAYESNCVEEENTPTVLGEGEEDPTVVDHQGALGCRIEYSNQDLNLLSSETNTSLSSLSLTGTYSLLSSFSGDLSLGLRLVARIYEPLLANANMGATDVFFIEDQALITYNTAGEVYEGAMQILDVSSPHQPMVRWELVFPVADVSTGILDTERDVIYLLGTVSLDSNDGALLSTPAILEEVGFNASRLPTSFTPLLDLPSFVTTDAYLLGGSIFVTTGNTGGLYEVDAESQVILQSLSLDDARSVTYNPADDRLYVFQGTPGRITRVDPDNFADFETFNVGGATIVESKSTIEYDSKQNLLLAAAGDGGTLVFDPVSETVLASLANPNLPDLEASLQTTNAVTLCNDLVLISNGEAGVRLAELGEGGELSLLGSIILPDGVSANGMICEDGWLFVAAGVDGLYLIRVLDSPYLQRLHCEDVDAVFCEDFAYNHWTRVESIEGASKWVGPSGSLFGNAYVLNQEAYVVRGSWVSTQDAFEHLTQAKHTSVKLTDQGNFFLKSTSNEDVGIRLRYDPNGSGETATVEARIGDIQNRSRRITVQFTFPEGQDFVVGHIYQQGDQVQVAVEFEDGTSLSSGVLTSDQEDVLSPMVIQLEPYDNSQTEVSAFDDIVVEEYTF